MPAPPDFPTKSLFGREWHTGKGVAKAGALSVLGDSDLLVCLGAGAVTPAGYIPNRYRIDGKVVESRGYLYGVFTSGDELVTVLNSSRLRSCPGSLAFFEYFLDARPVRVGLDLEYEFDDAKHAATGERLLGGCRRKRDFLDAVLVRRFLPWLNSEFGLAVTAADCYVLDASNAAKLSFHIVLRNVCIPAGGLAAFRAKVAASLSDLSPLLDLSAWQERPMRLGGCSKVGAARPLLPVSDVDGLLFAQSPPFDGSFTREFLEAHTWTWVPDGATALQGLATQVRRAPPSSTRTHKAAPPLPEVEMAKVLPYLKAAGFDRHHSLERAGGHYPTFRFHSSDYCPACSDTHKQGYWIQFFPDGRARQSAYSELCPRVLWVNPAQVAADDVEVVVDAEPLAVRARAEAPDAQPPVHFEDFVLQLLGWRAASHAHASFEYRAGSEAPQAPRWSVVAHGHQWHAPLKGSRYTFHVEAGLARMVLHSEVPYLAASFDPDWLPDEMRTDGPCGVPALDPQHYEPTLSKLFGSLSTLTPVTNLAISLLAQPDLPARTSLVFEAGPELFAVCTSPEGKPLLHWCASRLGVWVLVGDTVDTLEALNLLAVGEAQRLDDEEDRLAAMPDEELKRIEMQRLTDELAPLATNAEDLSRRVSEAYYNAEMRASAKKRPRAV